MKMPPAALDCKSTPLCLGRTRREPRFARENPDLKVSTQRIHSRATPACAPARGRSRFGQLFVQGLRANGPIGLFGGPRSWAPTTRVAPAVVEPDVELTLGAAARLGHFSAPRGQVPCEKPRARSGRWTVSKEPEGSGSSSPRARRPLAPLGRARVTSPLPARGSRVCASGRRCRGPCRGRLGRPRRGRPCCPPGRRTSRGGPRRRGRRRRCLR